MAKKYFSFQLLGGMELAEALGELPKSVQKPVLRKACIDAFAPTLAAANGLAGSVVGVVTGRYEKSYTIGTKLTKSQKADERDSPSANYFVTVYCGSTDPVAHLLEFGHLSRSGTHVEAYPVMRPAWDGTKEQVLSLLGASLWKELAAAAQKLNKKAVKGTLSSAQQRGILGY